MTGPAGSGDQKHQLEAIARGAMQANGLEPDFSPAALGQLAHLAAADSLGRPSSQYRRSSVTRAAHASSS